jgi:hypothetical protein
VKISGKSPWLLGIGSAVAAVFGVIIGVGQLGRVRVPQESEWAHVVSLCGDEAVDGATYAEALQLLEGHDLAVRKESGPCDGRSAIHVRVSPADVERLFPSSEMMGENAELQGQVAREAFSRTVSSGVIGDCTVYLRYPDDTKALVHGALHCLGYDHPRNAPAGHVMSPRYDRIGLDDWRGIQ